MRNASGKEWLTVGDILQEPGFQKFSRRQVEYAIDAYRIEPSHRIGIIRAFARNQLVTMLAALQRTTARTRLG